jgi:hypothetical protein
MVSLEWAASLGRAIPENWFPEVLNMTEEKARRFSKRFPAGRMVLPEPEVKKVEKKVAKKSPAKSKSAKKED